MLNYFYHLQELAPTDADPKTLAMELLSTLPGCLVMITKPDVRILVVEDEKLLSWSLTKSLSNWGFHVLPVSTGVDAIAQVEKGSFDVILLDYQLPDLDGLKVARCIRKKQPKATIILVTAFQLSELAVDAGLIDAYFNKPLDFQQLHRALLSLPGWSRPAGGVQESQPRLS